ncbi:MAG: hypothetical protein H6817_02475 [Phycisphaerales bacterium]|nr:hypothetical protein [Phycisphaerales bacterium]
MPEYHALSGKVPFGSMVRVAIAGFAGAALLAIGYTYAIVYIPLVYLNLLICIGFGCLVGWFVGSSARSGKVRNVTFVTVAGFISGCAALYCAWAMDIVARLGRIEGVEGVHFTLDPRIIWNYIVFVNERGFWSLRGHTPTGWELGAFWIIEALIIVGAATLVPNGMLRGRAFCEACERWIDNEHDLLRYEHGASDAVVATLAAENVAGLANIPCVHGPSGDFLRVDLACCPGCGESNYLSVKSLTSKVNKEGKVEVKEEDVVLLQRISAAQRDEVRELSARAAAAVEAEQNAAVQEDADSESPDTDTANEEPRDPVS